MSFLIMRNSRKGREFVAMSGSNQSYTQNILHARLYPTREDANRDKCGNEYVVGLGDLLPGEVSHG